MKPATVLILALAFAPTLFAQGAVPLRPNGEKIKRGPIQTDEVISVCPLGLRAQHLSDGDFVKTGNAHPKGTGQALHITVPDSSHGKVTEANLLIYGWTPKGRFSETAPNANIASSRQKVHFKAGESQSSADIWVAGFSAITSIEVSSATYSDRNIWKSSADLSCTVQPDLVMLVQP